ncbi:DNA processing protein DprA [Jiella endophytica]|uniref:DNA processing protein DprA n=1 Tax=Jiella endophytica TaxID=2558362 RepID=A0A4Y8RD71_9HYPH|nr:nucleotidyltransferase domain-containing protein [Jiella endophytica]TFF19904.1 DNA processing protein DprA [Jiella endophytica]
MTRDAILARLKAIEPRMRSLGVAALYLYGSYARNEAGPDSDIDLLADFVDGGDRDIMDFLAPYEELEKAFPGMEIGFSTRDRIVAAYRPSIENSAIRIF